MKSIKILLSLIFCIAIFSGSSCHNGGGGPNPPTPPKDHKIGLAPYAIMQPTFNCAAFKDSIKDLKGFHLSWVWWSFGDERNCIRELLRDPRLISYELHLINEVCQRNGNCGSYEYLHGVSVGEYNWRLKSSNPNEIARLRGYAQNAANFLYLDAKPSARCYISLGLESNLSETAMRNGTKALESVFPGCEFVTHGHRIPPYLKERHHNHPAIDAPCIVNLDGVTIKFPGIPNNSHPQISPQDVENYLNTYGFCDVMYIWDNNYNCIKAELGFVDPRRRVCDRVASFPLMADFIERKEQ